MLVATHDGSFHADEVFAVATLRLAGEPVEVVRTRDRDVQAGADLRVDVGFRYDPVAGDYDHHQRGFDEVRPNGVRLAAFGLVWRAYGARACGGDEAVADAVDASLVQGVDAADVGQALCTPLLEDVRSLSIGGVVGAFNPRWDESPTAAEAHARFEAAVTLAHGILAREVASAAAGLRAVAVVRRAIAAAADADPRLLELEANVPFKRVVVTEAPEALLVVYPKRQGYGVETVPRALGTFENRLDLPAAWAGLEDGDLARATGVRDVRFAHAKRFLAVAGTRAAALELARLALAERPRANE